VMTRSGQWGKDGGDVTLTILLNKLSLYQVNQISNALQSTLLSYILKKILELKNEDISRYQNYSCILLRNTQIKDDNC